MTTPDKETVKTTSAHTALDGYWYQLKVSILFALDLLAYRRLTDRIILEPVSEEDLEAEFKNEPSALTQGMSVSKRQLVVQCKLRSTGSWKIGDLARLLAHGKKRKPAKDRLKDPNISGRVASITGQARSTLTRENGQPTDSNLAQPSSVILLRARTPICASVF